jgi:excisionase family DNA binding protein
MSEKKLTPKEAADQAGVSISMIYQLCDERRLTHYRVGGRGRRGKILVDPADLEALMQTLKVEAGVPIEDSGDYPHLN